MNTVILLWNPLVSDYKIESFHKVIKALNRGWWMPEGGVIGQWAVYDHEVAEYGDRCFLLRVGDDHPGIVMSGWLRSNPFVEDNWMNDGTKRHYMKYEPELYIDNEELPTLTSEMLTKEISGFNWYGGHSGRVLDEEAAGKLEMLWLELLYKNRNLYEASPHFGCNLRGLEVNEVLNDYLQETYGSECDVCGHDPKALFGEDSYCHDYSLIIPVDEEHLPEDDSVWKHVYCICDSCQLVDEDKLMDALPETAGLYEKVNVD